MIVPRRQRTIAHPAVVTGFGYWSGVDVEVEFCPAPPGDGITFVRRDLPGAPRVSADVNRRVELPRRTVLADGSARVAMVEHVLAALAGLQIDNCLVVVNAEEMPGCDGSAREFVAALDAAGIVEQNLPAVQLIVERPLRLGDEQCWIEARPPKAGGLSVQFVLDYGPGTPIGRQEFSIDLSPDSFRRSLAACRTFLLEHEARLLKAQGLGHRVTPQDLLIFGQHGPVDNSLRFADECVRHKVLDVMGDLALAGCEIRGQIVAYRSGHQRNAELVRAMLHAFPPAAPALECA